MMAPDQWIPHKPKTWPWRIGRLREDVQFRTWHGHLATPEFTYRGVAAGTVVKIVMVSRFGDVGITTDLQSEHGYGARVFRDKIEPLTADEALRLLGLAGRPAEATR